MSISFFGKTGNGEDTFLYEIENEHFILKVTDYGAILQSLIDRRTGIDIVEGFDDVSSYEHHSAHFGAVIGRVANRIEGPQFTLNGTTYHLVDNEHGISLHGGNIGLDRRVYHGEIEENRIVLTGLVPDGEEGYPGNLSLKITYELMENGVDLKVEGTSDKDTLLGITNHSYYNLDGSESAMDEEVRLDADTYAEIDSRGLTLPVIKPVHGTPFDFTSFKELGTDIHADNEQLRLGNGYDHHFPVAGTGLREMAVCRGRQLQLTVLSNLPGFHMYTSNYLDGVTGKYGHHYPARSAVCFEPEYFPNGINYDGIEPKPILKAHETSVQEIRLVVAAR